MRLIHKNQRGFTLIELIVAIAITGLIIGGIATAIFQVFTVNALSSNHMLAVRQVQNAGAWISHDTQMAQSVSTGGMDILTLTWVGWEYECGAKDTCISTYEVRYTYDGVSDKLWRHQTITTAKYDSDGQLVDPQPDPQNSTTPIAEYINPIEDGDVDFDGNKLKITITASVGDAVEERTYEIMPRPSGY